MTLHNDILLLDVGGTFIKCSDGREIPVNSAGSREEIAASLREAVGDAGKVGVAIPGPFDYLNGIFLMKHKFAAVYGESFADLCFSGQSEETPSFRFMHDVNAALLGENPVGNTALVTIGTGLGFAYTRDGIIQKSAMGSPARSAYNLPYCDGILEDFISKRGIIRTYNELAGPSDVTVKEISERARAGEKAAVLAFSRTGTILAKALQPLLTELNINRVIMGGQISRSFDLMEEELRNGFGPGISVTPSNDIGGAVFRGLANLF